MKLVRERSFSRRTPTKVGSNLNSKDLLGNVLTFKWTILVTDVLLFCFKFNFTTMIEKRINIISLVWLWTLCTGWICEWFSMALRFRRRLRYIWVKKLKIIIIKIKNQNITSALIGQKAIVGCTYKSMENWRLCYCSNRQHFLSVYQRSKRLQMLGNHSKKSVNQSPPAQNYKLLSCSHNIPRGLFRQ